MAPVGLVIFDNDGVVVDSELLANEVLAAVLTGEGYPVTADECIRDFMGGSLDGVRSTVEERAGLELPSTFAERYHDRLFEAFSTRLRPVAGITGVLDALEGPYCLASSGTVERIHRSLAVTGLGSYFEGRIFSADMVRRAKPAPDLFLHAAAALSVDPSRCVVVEDSPNGVRAGLAAGMKVLGYAALTPAARLGGAHATFGDMGELPGLLRGLDD